MEFTKKAPNLKRGMNRLSHRLKEYGRRFCAVLLCTSMVISGFPGSFFQAFASDNDDADYAYELEGDALYEALCTAVSEGTTLDDELAFAGEYAEGYAELFEPDGTLYELKEFDYEKDSERDKQITLRVFARIKGDIPLDEDYRFDGDEEILFLITNRSDEEVSATICVDGRETDVITVLPASMIEVDDEVVGPGAVEADTEDDLEAAETETVTARSFSGGAPSGGGSSSGAGSGAVKDGDDAEEDSDADAENTSEDSEETSPEAEEAAGDEDTEIHRGHSSGKVSSGEKDEDSQNDGTAESDKDSSSESGEDKADSGKDRSDDASDSRDKADDRDNGRERSHERDDSSEDHDKADDSEHSGNRSHDRDRSDKGSFDSSNDDSDHEIASISSHKIGLLAASIEIEIEEDETEETESADAVEDDYEDAVVAVEEIGEADEEIVPDTEENINEVKPATPSNATPSDADHAINGIVYNPVRLGNRGAAAFATTAEDLELTRYYGINTLTAYDRIYTYMDSLLERSTELEEGDIEDAIELWNELMDAWDLIYEAEDNETLELSDSEYDSLDKITDEIYQNVLAAGYDPYGIMMPTLDDYELEIMSTDSLTGTGWTVSSSTGGGEVRLATSGNTTTVTGWTPGTVTLSRTGSTSVTYTILDDVRVCVYVSSEGISDEILKLLGIDSSTIDTWGYFPAGIVYVQASYLTEEKKEALYEAESDTAKSRIALITSEAEWEEILTDLEEMDTSEDVFSEADKANAGNSIPYYFVDALDYIGNGAESEKTAFFYMPGGSGYSSDFSDVIYHFDLRFYANTVTYIWGNNGITDGSAADGNIAFGPTTYITGETIEEMNPDFDIPNGYVYEGYYLDKDCTVHWDGSQKLTGDMTIYIKLSEGVDVVVEKVDSETGELLDGAQFLLGKVVDIEIEDENGEPTGKYETAVYYYDFDEYTGWISDINDATPITTSYDAETGQHGLIDVPLADLDNDNAGGGYYFLLEIAAPDGYVLWDESIEFTVTHIASDQTDQGYKEVKIISPEDSDMVTVTEDGNGFYTVIVIKNEPETFDVLIYKYADDGNSGNGDPFLAVNDNSLTGAEFILSRETEEGIYEYAIADTITYDGYDGVLSYQITDWTTEIEEATAMSSDVEGYVEILNLEAGTYTLTETKAPEGYELLIEDIVFIVDSEGNISIYDGPAEMDNGRICVANEESREAFDLNKEDSDGNKLEGAEFILGYFIDVPIGAINIRPYKYTDDGNYEYWYSILSEGDTSGTYIFDEYETTESIDEATTLTTDENGYFHIEGLLQSYSNGIGYFLVETKAPDGYNLLTDPIVFLVDIDGTIILINDDDSGEDPYVSVGTNEDGTWVMTVINDTGVKLPSAGGSGTLSFYVIGTFLSGSALWLLFLTLRRRRRWVED